MPYASRAQSRFIHMKARQGAAWAQKFVRDSHGTKVPNIDHVAKRKSKGARRRHRRRVAR